MSHFKQKECFFEQAPGVLSRPPRCKHVRYPSPLSLTQCFRSRRSSQPVEPHARSHIWNRRYSFPFETHTPYHRNPRIPTPMLITFLESYTIPLDFRIIRLYVCKTAVKRQSDHLNNLKSILDSRSMQLSKFCTLHSLPYSRYRRIYSNSSRATPQEIKLLMKLLDVQIDDLVPDQQGVQNGN